MTQTKIDPAKAEKQELIRWLSAQPCKGFCKLHHDNADHRNREAGGECSWIKDCCQGTGLAFPWASMKCPWCGGVHLELEKGCVCKGSGRVPKDLGLEVLLEAKPWVVLSALHDELVRSRRVGEPEADFTLAALRAVVTAFRTLWEG